MEKGLEGSLQTLRSFRETLYIERSPCQNMLAVTILSTILENVIEKFEVCSGVDSVASALRFRTPLSSGRRSTMSSSSLILDELNINLWSWNFPGNLNHFIVSKAMISIKYHISSTSNRERTNCDRVLDRLLSYRLKSIEFH